MGFDFIRIRSCLLLIRICQKNEVDIWLGEVRCVCSVVHIQSVQIDSILNFEIPADERYSMCECLCMHV